MPPPEDATTAPSALSLDQAREKLSPPPLLLPVPGTEPRKRFHPKVDYELISCGLHGHLLEGTDAAELRPEDAPFARHTDGIRWHRCLRCESWVPTEPPTEPSRQHPPNAAELQLPVRGRRLRDRYVLRLIVIDRSIHFLILAAITVAIFLFANDKTALHHRYVRILTALQSGVGGPTSGTHSGLLHDIDRLFTYSPTKLYVIGGVVALYAAVLAIESVGLWWAKRWAEYLTFVETAVLVPFEIYELTKTISVLKIITLVINLAVVLYLLLAHRLFGLRGGKAAAAAEYGDEG